MRQNIATLAVLIGRTPESRHAFAAAACRGLRIPPVTPGLPSDLIAQRPDIREAEAQLASANANVYSARAAFFPSIQLTGEGGYQSAVLKTLLRPESAFFNRRGRPDAADLRWLARCRASSICRRAGRTSCCSSTARPSSTALPTSSGR